MAKGFRINRRGVAHKREAAMKPRRFVGRLPTPVFWMLRQAMDLGVSNLDETHFRFALER